MAKSETRFKVVLSEGNAVTTPARQLIVDTETGVQYLFVRDGYGGGLCPLLDKDGKPALHNA